MQHLLTLFIILDTAHVFSPILLSWAHPGFRCVMLDEPWAYVVVPLALFLTGALVAVTTRWPSWMIDGYFFWNTWHFASQNYGVLRLCGVPVLGGACRIAAFIGTAAGMWYAPYAFGVHHWLTDIALSTRVMRAHFWWVFLAALAFLSPLGFTWSVAGKHMTPTLQMLMGLRFALGIYHFRVSALLWRFSNPQVRATIGQDLLRRREGPPEANYGVAR